MSESIETLHYASPEVVNAVTNALNAVRDASDKMLTNSNEFLSEKDTLPALQAALNGKQGMLTTDTTKVGGLWSTSSYSYATKDTLPAGGSWIVFYCTSFLYGSDRASGTNMVIRPGGWKLAIGAYSWWNICFRIA